MCQMTRPDTFIKCLINWGPVYDLNLFNLNSTLTLKLRVVFMCGLRVTDQIASPMYGRSW